jgi:hypothetical protein
MSRTLQLFACLMCGCSFAVVHAQNNMSPVQHTRLGIMPVTSTTLAGDKTTEVFNAIRAAFAAREPLSVMETDTFSKRMQEPGTEEKPPLKTVKEVAAIGARIGLKLVIIADVENEDEMVRTKISIVDVAAQQVVQSLAGEASANAWSFYLRREIPALVDKVILPQPAVAQPDFKRPQQPASTRQQSSVSWGIVGGVAVASAVVAAIITNRIRDLKQETGNVPRTDFVFEW